MLSCSNTADIVPETNLNLDDRYQSIDHTMIAVVMLTFPCASSMRHQQDGTWTSRGDTLHPRISCRYLEMG